MDGTSRYKSRSALFAPALGAFLFAILAFPIYAADTVEVGFKIFLFAFQVLIVLALYLFFKSIQIEIRIEEGRFGFRQGNSSDFKWIPFADCEFVKFYSFKKIRYLFIKHRGLESRLILNLVSNLDDLLLQLRSNLGDRFVADESILGRLSNILPS